MPMRYPTGVTGVELDSRRVVPGSLFLAVRGQARHGLAFAGEALKRGAIAIAWEPADDVEAPQYEVATVPVAGLGTHAGEIAARFWRHPSRELFTVGVTGTDGKTSTRTWWRRRWIASACPAPTSVRSATAASAIWPMPRIPRPIQCACSACWRSSAKPVRAPCAMEVSSHALDQGRVAGSSRRGGADQCRPR